jgi:hypothetical protein
MSFNSFHDDAITSTVPLMDTMLASMSNLDGETSMNIDNEIADDNQEQTFMSTVNSTMLENEVNDREMSDNNVSNSLISE